MSDVAVIQGDTALTPDQGTTSGRLSIQNGGMQLRQAAATARRAILRRAAVRLRRDIATLAIRNGVMDAAGRKLPIGELVTDRTLALEIDKDAPEKAPADYAIVGRTVPRLDIRDKILAQFTFMQDVEISGMLHGRVVRPSGFGATLPRFLA
jgi:nicotinate dehydrogenase subunit B